MKIIILGAGQVGGSLAETLNSEKHDITLVDMDRHVLQYYADRLDIRTVCGPCSYPGVLRQAGADSADIIIAVTDNDEANIVACQVAYTLFNLPTKMARIRSRHYFIRKDLFAPDHIPIDVIVSPELIVSRLISELVAFPGTLRAMDFGDGAAKLVAVRPYYGGALLAKTLKQAHEYLGEVKFHVVALYRDREAVELTDDTEIEIGDRIFFIAATDDVKKVISAFRRQEEPFKKIMIAGGGNIGSSLARALQDDYSVKLIDQNRTRCEALASDLRNVTVLCGSANDSGLLSEENIEHVDLFLALTNDDEANIISAIQAKQLGARQTCSLITRNDYFDVIESGAINVRLSPSLATIGAILAHVRQGDVRTVYATRRGKGEVMEVVVHGDNKTSRLVGKALQAIKFPKETNVAAIIRGKKVLFPQPELVVEAQDHVIVNIRDKKAISYLEKLFQVSSGFF